MSKAILIKQVKSTSQTSAKQKATLKALGLRGVGSEIHRTDTRALRGMLNQVQFWIEASQLEKQPTSRPKKKAPQRGFKLG